jgi:LmbE family N-acetylglucosaminyl deacetylase
MNAKPERGTPPAKALVRSLLQCAVRVLLRLRSRRLEVRGETRCLVVSPHPDDSTLGCGGLIVLKRLDAAPVDIVFVTDGSASHPAHPTLARDALAKQRMHEELVALGILGVDRSRAHFLGVRDGTLAGLAPAQAEDVVGRIAGLLSEVGPDEVFLPYRDDRSSEHEACFRLVMLGLARSGLRPRIFEYPVWSRWDPRPLLRPLLFSRRIWRLSFPGYGHLKRLALGAYASQIEPTPPWTEARLSRKFLSIFSADEEFFLEIKPPAPL